MLNILRSIFVCAAASSFFAWVVGAHVSAPYVIAGSTHVLASSMFQCYLWRCRGAWRMLSIRPWFFCESPCLGFVSGPVSLSQVDVAFNVLDLNVVDIYWCVGFHHHLLSLFIYRPWLSLSAANSCRIHYSSCGVLPYNRAVHPPMRSRGLDNVQTTGEKAACLHDATSAFDHEDNLDGQSNRQGHTRADRAAIYWRSSDQKESPVDWTPHEDVTRQATIADSLLSTVF